MDPAEAFSRLHKQQLYTIIIRRGVSRYEKKQQKQTNKQTKKQNMPVAHDMQNYIRLTWPPRTTSKHYFWL